LLTVPLAGGRQDLLDVVEGQSGPLARDVVQQLGAGPLPVAGGDEDALPANVVGRGVNRPDLGGGAPPFVPEAVILVEERHGRVDQSGGGSGHRSARPVMPATVPRTYDIDSAGRTIP
jgi:hypothetical protein